MVSATIAFLLFVGTLSIAFAILVGVVDWGLDRWREGEER